MGRRSWHRDMLCRARFRQPVRALQYDDVVDSGFGQPDCRAQSSEAGSDDERRMGAVVVRHAHAAGSWVSSLTHVGTDGSSGRGYRSESHTIEFASRWYGWRGFVTTPA